MNLLIIDDIPNVVEGLCNGICWRELGFDHVFKAYNALDARAVLVQKKVEVMLCDIEMPLETGLELFMWTKEQGLDIRVIFLTSHVEFAYVQRALKLGGFDYIVQPAPYTEVREAVQRAVADVTNTQEQSWELEFGRTFYYQSRMISAACLKGILRNTPNMRTYRGLERLGIMPGENEMVFPILLQIQRWRQESVWEAGLLDFALMNVLEEIFAPYGAQVVLTNMEMQPWIFGIVISVGQLSGEMIERQMYFFTSVCQQYFKCDIGIYLDDPIPLFQINPVWERLWQRCRENIALQKGVFHIQKMRQNTHVYRMPEIKQWASLLKDRYRDALESRAISLLDEMVENGKMNPQSLMAFYLDFMEMLYTAVSGDSGRVPAFFDTPEKMEIYRSGMRSVDDMKALIRLVTSCMETTRDTMDPKSRVERVMRYINEHLDSDMKREDIAAQANLSPDYMARIFKMETGVTIKEYIIQQKMKMAQNLLRTTNLPVSFVAAKVGYYNFSHFSYTYKKEMGVSPQDERKGR